MHACNCAFYFVLFSVVDSGDNDLSPAFEPGSYFQNAVENSVTVQGILDFDL